MPEVSSVLFTHTYPITYYSGIYWSLLSGIYNSLTGSLVGFCDLELLDNRRDNCTDCPPSLNVM